MICAETFAVARARGIKAIRLVIYQPRVFSEPQVWGCSIDDLERFGAMAYEKGMATRDAAIDYERLPEADWQGKYLHPEPNADDCAFCKAMATCPAYAKSVDTALVEVGMPNVEAFASVSEETVATKLRELPADRLAAGMASVDMIEGLCTAMRAETERRLLAGEQVPGFGLELGRKGARKWADPVLAEELIRETFRLTVTQACNLKLKSPTQLEELTKVDPETNKAPIGPKQWKRLEAMVTQTEPKPSVKLAKAIKKPYQPPPQLAADAFPLVADDLA